jgi:hypothetical protein
MKLPIIDEAAGGPASTHPRPRPSVEDRGARRNTPSGKERCAPIPMPMMLIFAALVDASRD